MFLFLENIVCVFFLDVWERGKRDKHLISTKCLVRDYYLLVDGVLS